MLVWRKLSSEKWVDSWQERLAFLGPERLVITQIANTRRMRLEIFDITSEESEVLRKHLGGEIRDLNYPNADWVQSFILKKPISIRGRLRDSFAITLARFDLMAQLERRSNGLRMSELSRSLMVTGGNVTGIVDQLEREKLVVRALDRNDL